MRGFQPGEARVLPQNYADGGVVSTIKGMLGLGKKKPESLPADLNKLPPTGAGPAPSQPKPKEDPKKAISQYNGMSTLERRMKEADAYADGGVVRGIADAVRPFSESVGGYWSNSNKEFEATNPGVGDRFVRTLNPVTGFGSAVGAMYDAAGNGSARDAAIAAAQAAPMFAAMKAVPAAKSLIPTAPQIAVATGKTAAKAAGGTGAGVAADEVQARGFANGGLVRGPGTGISDDIEDEVEEGTFIMPADSTEAVGPEVMDRAGKAVPVRLSNGESKLPPEALQAIGAEVMEAIKEVTHTPAAKQARGFNPQGDGRMGFADGGVVRPEDRPLTIADRARQPGYAFAAGTYTPKPAAQPTPAPQRLAPAATTSAQVVRDVNSFSAAPAAPRPAAAPAPSIAARVAPQTGGASGSWEAKQNPAQPTMPTDVRGWRTKAVIDGAAEDAQAAWDRGSPMAAAGSVIRGAVTAVPTAFMDVGSDVVDLVGGPVGSFYDGLTGNTSAPASAKVAASQPVAPKTVAPTSAAPAASPATTQPKPVSSTPEASKPSATGSAASADGKEIMPGVYRQGNSYGDSPEAAASGARPGQGPSTQNQSIAAALAQRSGQRPDQPADVMGIYARASEALKGVAEAQRALDQYGPGSGGQGGGAYIKHSGNDWETEKNLKNLRTSASSITNRPGRRGEPSVEQQAYLKALDADMAARSGNNPAAIEAMRQQGETARIGMREAGENARSARREGLAAELGRGQLDLQRSAQGFTTRQAERQERLYADYDAAKTPEERATIAQKIRDLSGKSSQDGRYQLVRGEQVFDEKANALRNTGERLYDTQAGRFVDGGNSVQAQAMPERQDQLKAGQVYETSRGPARWDGKQFTSVAG